jgi:hypothetical protein
MMLQRRQTVTLGMVALVLLLGACSTYRGEKLGIHNGNTVAPTGIPYTLVRPEYTLSRTSPVEGAKLPTYTLSVTYEADPEHYYTLKIDPGVFADPDFTMKLGTNGTLQSTKATFTEQITPTITALGSFATNLIGALATGALDKDSVRRAIIVELTGNACEALSDVPRLPAAPPMPAPSVASAMRDRIEAFKDDDAFADLFHYVTERERSCLETARSNLRTTILTSHKAAIDRWEAARRQYLSTHPTDTLFVERLSRAVATDDSRAFDALRSEIKAAIDEAGQPTPIARERDSLLSLAVPAAKGQAGTEAQDKLDFFISMDTQTWRGRHVLFLEREIDHATLFALRRPQLSQKEKQDIAKYSQELRRQHAATIGVTGLYDRSVELAAFIAKIPDKSVQGGRAPAVAEYATARAELDEVLKQIEAQRSRVLTDAKPAPPPPAPPLKATKLRRVSRDTIERSKTPGWINGEGANAPNYVLILKEVE